MVVTNSDDYYELLGLGRDADEKEIKSAYKKAARKYHPDNSETGNEELFKKIGQAYETLKDPNKKAIYDQYGAEGLKGAQGFSGFGGSAGFEDLGDIFSSFFGGGFASGSSRSARQSTRGQDHTVEISIDFLDPINETKKTIRINPLVHCKDCDGKGASNAEDIVTCSTCHGQGQVSSVQNTILGQFRQVVTCPTCHGQGTTIKNPCKSCRGKGLKREAKEIEVKLPPGIYDGASMRLSGMGDAGQRKGPPGDIYLLVHVKPHPKFKREGADIYSQIEIGIVEAALGLKLKLPTIYGEKELEIQAGTQSNQTYTIYNEGMPKVNNPSRRGDHYVTVKVVVPNKFSSKEKELLVELQKLRSGRDIKL